MDAGNINFSGNWIRSSSCGPQHNCVELCHAAERVIIRDSKSGAATLLLFDRDQWSAFVRSCREAI